jgi:hypothetical protein
MYTIRNSGAANSVMHSVDLTRGKIRTSPDSGRMTGNPDRTQKLRAGHYARPVNPAANRRSSTRANRRPTRPGRNAQFEHINAQSKAFLRQGLPVISVDTKKKELIGNFKNAGREWQPQGQPEETLVHDFADRELGKVIPYGVYDVGKNWGWISVGMDHDTSGSRRSVVAREADLKDMPIARGCCGHDNLGNTRLGRKLISVIDRLFGQG